MISEFLESVLFEKKRTTDWSRNFLNQFCFEKQPQFDLGISWISFVWKRTNNPAYTKRCFEWQKSNFLQKSRVLSLSHWKLYYEKSDYQLIEF